MSEQQKWAQITEKRAIASDLFREAVDNPSAFPEEVSIIVPIVDFWIDTYDSNWNPYEFMGVMADKYFFMRKIDSSGPRFGDVAALTKMAERMFLPLDSFVRWLFYGAWNIMGENLEISILFNIDDKIIIIESVDTDEVLNIISIKPFGENDMYWLIDNIDDYIKMIQRFIGESKTYEPHSQTVAKAIAADAARVKELEDIKLLEIEDSKQKAARRSEMQEAYRQQQMEAYQQAAAEAIRLAEIKNQTKTENNIPIEIQKEINIPIEIQKEIKNESQKKIDEIVKNLPETVKKQKFIFGFIDVKYLPYWIVLIFLIILALLFF